MKDPRFIASVLVLGLSPWAAYAAYQAGLAYLTPWIAGAALVLILWINSDGASE